MWLSRNTKVLDSFSPQKSGYSVFGFTDMQHFWCEKLDWHPTIQSKRIMDHIQSHTFAHVHNLAHVNCCTCTYFFQKQTTFLFDIFIKKEFVYWTCSQKSSPPWHYKNWKITNFCFIWKWSSTWIIFLPTSVLSHVTDTLCNIFSQNLI